MVCPPLHATSIGCTIDKDDIPEPEPSLRSYTTAKPWYAKADENPWRVGIIGNLVMSLSGHTNACWAFERNLEVVSYLANLIMLELVIPSFDRALLVQLLLWQCNSDHPLRNGPLVHSGDAWMVTAHECFCPGREWDGNCATFQVYRRSEACGVHHLRVWPPSRFLQCHHGRLGSNRPWHQGEWTSDHLARLVWESGLEASSKCSPSEDENFILSLIYLLPAFSHRDSYRRHYRKQYGACLQNQPFFHARQRD